MAPAQANISWLTVVVEWPVIPSGRWGTLEQRDLLPYNSTADRGGSNMVLLDSWPPRMRIPDDDGDTEVPVAPETGGISTRSCDQINHRAGSEL